MDILKTMKEITNLDDYISVSQDVQSKNVKVQINITTVLTLKGIRSFEIQYLMKFNENGIACIILDRLLASPPSKAWESGLGKELICLIQYWLVAIKKHLLYHGHQWWTFLKQLLIFIKDIRSKSTSMPNILVEYLTENLLAIATSDIPDAFQRYEIMHALNVCCAESSREIRFALRNKFADYFVKLASQIATSGYFPCQYSDLECLLRWLIPRNERRLRASAAEKWFPPDLYPNTAVQIFKQTSWANFYQDARNFLNELNFANGLVTSFVCRRLSIGETVVISGSEKEDSWLDLNSVGPCASVLLDSRALEPFGVRDFTAAFALCLTEDITLAVQLHSESGINLSIDIDKSPTISPSGVNLGDVRHITMSISSRTDLRQMDLALKRVFGDKYQLLMNLNSEVSLSPPRSIRKGKSGSNSEEDTRFSHPVEVKRKRHIGQAVKSRIPRGANTPSSASFSSLAYLQDKLEALPPLKYDKERVSVCAKPALSRVSELSERDDRTITTSGDTTILYQPCGVAQNKKRTVKTVNIKTDSKTKPYRKSLKSQSDTEATKTRRCSKNKCPVVSDNEVSVLLATSIGSNDDAVINETVERLSKKKGDFDRRGIVDLLIQEALQEREKATDSGINTDDNKNSQSTKENSEAIEGTPVLINENVRKSKIHKKKLACTVVSKSTTDDESNTEVINETPFVTSRNRSKDNAKPNSTFDVNIVENFFSQHYTANKEGDIVISPTTAKKINQTSSESSLHFDDCLIMDENFNADDEIFQFNEIDIIECLNDVVDKVCHEFDKCSEYLREKNEIYPGNLPVTAKKSTKSPVVGKSKTAKTKARSKPKREIKIKFKTTPEEKHSKRVLAKKIKKAEQKSPKKMSIITELVDEEESFVGNEVREVSKVETPKEIQKGTNVKDSAPLVRQRRKLYSPKDNELQIEKTTKRPTPETDDDDAHSDLQTKNTTPKTTVSCYEEIENERKKCIRSKPRIFKGKVQEPPSPRTLKNNETFDKLKETVEGSENIVLIDKTNLSDKYTTRKRKQTKQIEAYNFTSDSEDEDFIKKKIEIRRKISSTTISSVNSKASNRRGRKKNPVNYSELKSSDDEAKKPPVKRKPATRAIKQKAVKVKRVIDLADEKMREATDTMNTSLVIESKPEKNESPNIELILKDLPEMEPISDTEEPKRNVVNTFPKTTNKKPETSSIKPERKKKVNLKPIADKEDNRSVESNSPLPGLVVEPIRSRKDDADESITANMALKFKKIYQDGPDQNESNITQHMLSDIERNNSQQNLGLSVTDEIRAEYDNLQIVEENNKRIKIREKSELSEKKIKSNPIKEFDDEIIEIPKQKQTKTKVNDKLRKPGKLNKFTEEIIEIVEEKISHNSPMSIASYGINAHNDLEAAPPSPDTIKENVQPREIEDLDKPMREYYEKLNKEINKSHDDSKHKSTSEVHNKSEDKSPIVAVQRLPIDDISKYLPSPKSSTTGSERTPLVVVKRMSLDDIDKFQSQRSSHSETEKSPMRKRVLDDFLSLKSLKPGSSKAKSKDTREKAKCPVMVNIARISLEEFDEWLPPMPDPTKKTKIHDSDYKPLSRKSKGNLRLTYELNKDKSHRGSYLSEKSSILRERPTNTSEEETNEPRLTRSFTRKLNASKTTRTSVDIPNKIESNTTRKSNIISPVKSFEQFVTNLRPSDDSDDKSVTKIRKLTKPKALDSKTSDNLEPSDHSDDENTNIRIFAKPKTPKFKDVTAASTIFTQRASSPIRVEREISAISEVVPNKKFKYDDLVTISEGVPNKKPKYDDLVTISEVVPNKKPKYDDLVTISEVVPNKKSKYDNIVTISESGPSIPSVQDWFKRTEASTKGIQHKGNTSQSSEDAIKYILEKLDTTLRELDHNTHKKFVNLFVETQSQLTEQKEERRKMYQNALNHIMEYTENMFVDLNRKSREMDIEFMDSLKQRSFELLKQDCKQKRAMIVLLKEDVQSVLDHIDKNRSTDS